LFQFGPKDREMVPAIQGTGPLIVSEIYRNNSDKEIYYYTVQKNVTIRKMAHQKRCALEEREKG
jgi:hypothetical protein